MSPARPVLNKIILFYGFTPLTDPEAIRLWQRDLCESLNLKGRILLSPHGINGTLGGTLHDLKRYVKKTKEFAGFKKIDFKWSEGTGDDFPRLSVKVRSELVTFGRPAEIRVTESGVLGGGKHLTPEEVHQLLDSRPSDVVFFDGRNAFEAKIGRFKNAVVPETATTRDFISEIESGKYDHLKSKAIVTYCTGGIRCEVLSTIMKERGFDEVYQIEGGIVRYGEKYGNDGLWEGSLYTFDARMSIDFAPGAAVIGRCDTCSAETKAFHNCIDPSCHEQLLLCDECAKDPIKRSCPTVHRANYDRELIG